MDFKQEHHEIRVEPYGLRIAFPRNGFTERNVSVLRQMLLSKRKLIQKALSADSLDVVLTEDRVVFPWFTERPQDLDMEACLTLIAALFERAKSGRSAPQLRDYESERYTFNRFLTALELDGPKYQNIRKSLMKNLSGTVPFPDKATEEAYYKERKNKNREDDKKTLSSFEYEKWSKEREEY